MSKLLSLLQSKLLAAFLGSLVFMGTVAFLISDKLKPGAPTELVSGKSYQPSTISGSWEFVNPELEQMIDELRRERELLQKRSQQLDELEVRIKTDRNELSTLIVNVRKLQEEFDRSILKVQEEEAINLKRLAKVYASMEPAGAVVILRELDDYSLVKILLYLKEPEAAPILEALARISPAEAKRAAALSESLRTALTAKVGAKQPGPSTLAQNNPAPKPKPATP